MHRDICFMRAWSCQPLGFFTHALYCCAGNREESIRAKKEGGRNRAGDRRENLKLTSCGGALPPLLLAGVSIVASLRVRDEPSPTIPTTAVVSSSCWWTLLRGVACCHAASYCLGCWFSATVFPVLKPVRTSGRRARVHDRRTALAVGKGGATRVPQIRFPPRRQGRCHHGAPALVHASAHRPGACSLEPTQGT